jgi:hypothetical protein
MDEGRMRRVAHGEGAGKIEWQYGALRSTRSFAIAGEILEALGRADVCREESRGVLFYTEDTRPRCVEIITRISAVGCAGGAAADSVRLVAVELGFVAKFTAWE